MAVIIIRIISTQKRQPLGQDYTSRYITDQKTHTSPDPRWRKIVKKREKKKDRIFWEGRRAKEETKGGGEGGVGSGGRGGGFPNKN